LAKDAGLAAGVTSRHEQLFWLWHLLADLMLAVTVSFMKHKYEQQQKLKPQGV
jgi:hypothetical protein